VRRSALEADEVRAIARLARLALTDDEIERLRFELASILTHIAVLSEVDTTDVEPMTHAAAIALRLRADVVEPSLPVAVALAGAPAIRDDAFAVPAVIRGE
jgi:aspartyl-tRNA(Asn)/glutamyl-tRNA(Gln) amidotransferase subunit C